MADAGVKKRRENLVRSPYVDRRCGYPPYDWERFKREERFEKAVQLATRVVLDAMYVEFDLDTRGANFEDTPERVARAYLELFAGAMDDGQQVKEILSKQFPAQTSEMVVVGPVQVWSMCPHHLLPVEMQVWLGYLPNKRVLGLSKLARLAELLAKKPELQETTTSEIAGALYKGLKPKGAACLIRGRHLCMAMRGVKKEAITTTTQLKGAFLRPEVRAEFLAAVRADIGNGGR